VQGVHIRRNITPWREPILPSPCSLAVARSVGNNIGFVLFNNESERPFTNNRMTTANTQASKQETQHVVVKPLLAWRILIGIFSFGCAQVLIRATIVALQGEQVEAIQFILGAGLLAVGGWLFPQTVVIDDTAIQMTRYFGLMRTRIPIEEIDFYWPTTRYALREYLRLGSPTVDRREARIEKGQAVLLITQRGSTKRIVLAHYHVGRDRVIDELKRRGVRHFDEATRQPV
jgi:hypothetical protein